MPTKFDVIIIGSGAGGGTLARELAPSGKSILILERGDWLKREAQNWDATAVFVDNRYVSGVSAASALLRGWSNKIIWRGALSPAPRGFRRAASLRWRLTGLADQLRGPRAVLHARRADVSRAWTARSGPHRAAGQRALSMSAGLPRAAHPAPFHRPVGGRVPPDSRALCDSFDRGRHGVQHLHPLPDLRRISLPGACEGGRGNRGGAARARVFQCDAHSQRQGPQARN